MGEHTPYIDLTISKLEEIIEKYFNIENFVVSDNQYVFYIKEEKDIKEKFLDFHRELKSYNKNLIPLIEKKEDKFILLIFGGLPPKEDNKKIPILLFIVTIFTVTLDGYLRSMSPVYFDVIKNYNPIQTMIYFTIALLGIIGIHEMGHKIALAYHNIKASWPNFIPGIPGIFPTFGAIISQREPPTNRDILFDIGFAGPIAGFIATILVTIFATLTAPVITIQQLHQLEIKYGKSQPFPVPILYTILQDLIHPIGENQIVIVSPLIWASIVGFIITGLNLLPAWQLDGGHLARAAVGEKYHSILTIASIAILFFTGYWAMAIFVLILYAATGNKTARPLDDVSPLSKPRLILFIVSIILAFLCLPNILTTFSL